MRQEKASLILDKKESTDDGLLIQLKVWRITKSDRYPLGLKYRLVLVDPARHEVLLLFDNHWPKGPHVHWGDQERPYEFFSLEVLLKDFDEESKIEEKRNRENKKNRN